MRACEEELEALGQSDAELLRLREMLEYQIKDIDAAKLKAGEEEKLTERRDKLLHLEKINRQVGLACRALCDGEKATVTALCDRAEAALSSISGIIPECDGLMERIAAIRAEAEDIAERVREFADEDVGIPPLSWTSWRGGWTPSAVWDGSTARAWRPFCNSVRRPPRGLR